MAKKDEKLVTFVVNMYPANRNPDAKVEIRGTFVQVKAPEGSTFGEIQKIAEEYMRPLCEMKVTEIRNTGYHGPM